MRPLQGDERTRQETTAEETFNDTCTLYVSVNQPQDQYGQEIHGYIALADVPCGFSIKRGHYKDQRGQLVIIDADAVLRVSLSEHIAEADYVTVRGQNYSVDGVWTGATVRAARLKPIDALPVEIVS